MPVTITFRPLFYFAGFQIITDRETEAYYTAGSYDMNRDLGTLWKKELSFCSYLGIRVTVGKRVFEVRESCTTIRILWPP